MSQTHDKKLNATTTLFVTLANGRSHYPPHQRLLHPLQQPLSHVQRQLERRGSGRLRACTHRTPKGNASSARHGEAVRRGQSGPRSQGEAVRGMLPRKEEGERRETTRARAEESQCAPYPTAKGTLFHLQLLRFDHFRIVSGYSLLSAHTAAKTV